MSDSKKKRLSMLDSLSAVGTPAPSSMMKTNRPLRAARDAVDGHKVWDLDPDQIDDSRVRDRLDHDDITDLRDSIETTGQTVPILVRRHPSGVDKYLLVYGRRRLEAIRTSNKVDKVRALIANIDENTAVEAQISENMARRDLTYIEKALFAHELIESGYGNQSRVAEVLTVTKSSVSMGLAIVNSIGPDLIRAIGPAQGIGRPRWEALSKALEVMVVDDDLIDVARHAQDMTAVAILGGKSGEPQQDVSVAAFEAVFAKVVPQEMTEKPAKRAPKAPPVQALLLDGKAKGSIARTAKGVRLELGQGDFADWIEDQAQSLIEELHARWQQGRKK
jgi:ParB family chromosome partitioning protein